MDMRGIPIHCDERACVRLYISPEKGVWVSGPMRMLERLGIPPSSVKVYKTHFQIWGEEAIKKTPLWPAVQRVLDAYTAKLFSDNGAPRAVVKGGVLYVKRWLLKSLGLLESLDYKVVKSYGRVTQWGLLHLSWLARRSQEADIILTLYGMRYEFKEPPYPMSAKYFEEDGELVVMIGPVLLRFLKKGGKIEGQGRITCGDVAPLAKVLGYFTVDGRRIRLYKRHLFRLALYKPIYEESRKFLER